LTFDRHSFVFQKLYVGIDLGGTTLTAGVMNDAGDVLSSVGEDLPSRDITPEDAIAMMIDLTNKALKKGSFQITDVAAIGVGAPGNLDFENGVIINLAAFPSWSNVAVCDALKRHFNCPVFLENDANAALLAEWWAGAAKSEDVHDVVMMTLGTGIGGGVMIDNKLLKGSVGMAGEIGHMILEIDGRQCKGTGVKGVFERYASATAVVERATEAAEAQLKNGASSAAGLAKILEDGKEIQCKDVFDLAKKGDALAQQLVDETAEYIAIGAINICRVVDPQVGCCFFFAAPSSFPQSNFIFNIFAQKPEAAHLSFKRAP
jgi:glucokinase